MNNKNVNAFLLQNALRVYNTFLTPSSVQIGDRCGRIDYVWCASTSVRVKRSNRRYNLLDYVVSVNRRFLAMRLYPRLIVKDRRIIVWEWFGFTLPFYKWWIEG